MKLEDQIKAQEEKLKELKKKQASLKAKEDAKLIKKHLSKLNDYQLIENVDFNSLRAKIGQQVTFGQIPNSFQKIITEESLKKAIERTLKNLQFNSADFI